MESNDSYPVFHTRLERTFRRRFTTPDGSDVGWLILNPADQFTEVAIDTVSDKAATTSGLSDAIDDASRHRRGGDDPPRLSIPAPR